MSDSATLHHGDLVSLGEAEAAAFWAWVAGGGSRPEGFGLELRWLHGTFDDGLVWGEFRNDRWEVGSDFGADLVPELRRSALWELRLFGVDGEVLIWPVGDEAGREVLPLAGRVLRDTADAPALGDPSRSDPDGREALGPTGPVDGQLLLFGDRLLDQRAKGRGFSLIGDATGARQVVPLDLPNELFADGRWCPATLSVREYLETDPVTNSLRVAATRFVDLFSTRPPEES